MRYSIVVAAIALSALALSACDKPTTVVTPPPAVVNVPGPAGPQGATGAQGMPAEKGATGATGATGEQGKTGGDTIVVVPAPSPQR
jgi:hypothetical protein